MLRGDVNDSIIQHEYASKSFWCRTNFYYLRFRCNEQASRHHAVDIDERFRQQRRRVVDLSRKRRHLKRNEEIGEASLNGE
jgi:hypothetical protein